MGPIYLSEIAPSKIRGSVGTPTYLPCEVGSDRQTFTLGVLTQLSIVLGIMLTQATGLFLANPRQWRFVLLISSAISIAQFVLSTFIVESPSYLGRKNSVEDQKSAARRLWGSIEGISSMQIQPIFHLIYRFRIVSW